MYSLVFDPGRSAVDHPDIFRFPVLPSYTRNKSSVTIRQANRIKENKKSSVLAPLCHTVCIFRVLPTSRFTSNPGPSPQSVNRQHKNNA